MTGKYFYNYPFAKTGLLAIPLLLFIFMMKGFFPQSYQEGYKSFIVAFEFAKNPDEIHILFDGFSAEDFRKTDIGNYLDFGFMLTYTLFMVFFFKIGARYFQKKWLLTGIPLSVIVLIADVLENFLMLKITSIYTPDISNAELMPILKSLHIITWIKWGGLAIIFFLHSIKLMGRDLLKSILGAIYIIPLILAFPAFSNNPLWVSLFTHSIFSAFLLMFFNAFRYKRKKRTDRNYQQPSS